MTTKNLVDSKLKSSMLFLDVSKDLKNLLKNDKIKYTKPEFTLLRNNALDNLKGLEIYQENYNPKKNHELVISAITSEIIRFYGDKPSVAKKVKEDYLELPK